MVEILNAAPMHQEMLRESFLSARSFAVEFCRRPSDLHQTYREGRLAYCRHSNQLASCSYLRTSGLTCRAGMIY